MADLHRITKGVIAESLVLSKLLEADLEVFKSVADISGVDFVARARGGNLLEIQVKGVFTDKDPEWFQLTTYEDIDLLRKRPYYVVGVTRTREFWVFPPEVFLDITYANTSTNAKGLTTVDLNLATTRRGASATNRERLQHLQDNWALLVERSLGNRSPEGVS